MGIRVGIVGVTGYTGMELLRLIHHHPKFELAFATSRTNANKKISELFPHFDKTKEGNILIIHPEEIKEDVELVFLAVPHKSAMEFVGNFLSRGVKVVDLSADFRLSNISEYESWYNTSHTQKELVKESVYGLIEIYKENIKNARLVANPGCYPTSIILGLYPALKNNLIKSSPIIIDSKSGTSGAGRSAKLGVIFSEVYDNFRPYSIGGVHRHTPEIEEQLSKISHKQIKVSFNPHLVPIQRGIISTMYTLLKDNITFEELYRVYMDFAHENKWIRVYKDGKLVETRNVRGTMYCDISLCLDSRTNTLLIISCIDNICRGASGQAIANANLMCGLDMELGLNNLAIIP
jgi:N-acetyl-gamma-glutamyl-phosphate reductase